MEIILASISYAATFFLLSTLYVTLNKLPKFHRPWVPYLSNRGNTRSLLSGPALWLYKSSIFISFLFQKCLMIRELSFQSCSQDTYRSPCCLVTLSPPPFSPQIHRAAAGLNKKEQRLSERRNRTFTLCSWRQRIAKYTTTTKTKRLRHKANPSKFWLMWLYRIGVGPGGGFKL